MWERRRRRSMSGSSIVVIVVAMIIAVAASVALYSSYAVQINSGSTTTSWSLARISSTESGSSQPSSTNNSTSAVLVLIPDGIYANQQLNFEPTNIKIVIGVNNTVRWVNKDYTLHTISALSTPKNSSSFDSAPIFQGGSFEYTFTVPGQYVYYCPWHPGWMRGTVTVLTQNGRA